MKTAAASALSLLCLAPLVPSAAAAAEWETRVVGEINIGVGVADIDESVGIGEGVGVFRDGEVQVRAELQADNGITFGARVELEAFTDDDQIDENFGFVSGPFGTIIVGGADTALNEHGGIGVVKPTGPYLNYYDDDAGETIPGNPGGFIGEDDAIGVRYFINFSGFEIGASYQPDGDADGDEDTNSPQFSEGDVEDQFAVGASYTGEFGDFGFAVGGGYLTNDEEDQYHVGLEVGFAGFTAAGFFNVDDNGGAPNEELYGVGAMYATGPYTIGGGYVHT
ncbi:MAG: porin, partial [Pseudomonadota bacterium]